LRTQTRPARGGGRVLRRIFASVRANSPAIREARFARRVVIGVPHGASPPPLAGDAGGFGLPRPWRDGGLPRPWRDGGLPRPWRDGSDPIPTPPKGGSEPTPPYIYKGGSDDPLYI